MATIAILSCQEAEFSTSEVNNLPHRTLPNGLDGPWDEVGVIHNRCLAYVDEWLVEKYNDEWETKQAQDSAREVVKQFIKDSTEYDYEIAWEVIDSLVEAEQEPTFVYVIYCLDSLKAEDVITELEYDYLARLSEIVFVYSLSDIDYKDSLEAFVDDMLEEDWGSSTICLSIASIALYSWEFQLNGWEFDPGHPVYFNWGEFGDADTAGAVGGAIAGLCISGVGGIIPGLVGGGIAGSVGNGVYQFLTI